MRGSRGSISRVIAKSSDIQNSAQQGIYNTTIYDGLVFQKYKLTAGNVANGGPAVYDDVILNFYITPTASISDMNLALWVRGTADGDDTKIYTCDSYATDASTFTERTVAVETALGHAITTDGVELAIDLQSYFTSTGWKAIKVEYDGVADIDLQLFIDTTR